MLEIIRRQIMDRCSTDVQAFTCFVVEAALDGASCNMDRDRSFGHSVVFCCMERRWLGCIRYIGRVDIVIFIYVVHCCRSVVFGT